MSNITGLPDIPIIVSRDDKVEIIHLHQASLMYKYSITVSVCIVHVSHEQASCAPDNIHPRT